MNLETKLSSLKLKNPVIGASGPMGFLHEWQNEINLESFGALTLKTTTPLEKIGNATPRMVEVDSGMLNSIGLQNPGLEKVLDIELPKLKNLNTPLIGNIGGNSIEEFLLMAKAYDSHPQINMIEVNVSCPNVKNHGVNFAHDLGALEELAQSLRKVVKKNLFFKLSPNLPNLVPYAQMLEKNGIDGLTVSNTYIGMKIDLKTGKPILANGTGGLSGPCIKALTVRHVYEVTKNCSLPVIGLGGVVNAEDVLEYIYAGATAIGIGAGTLHNPNLCSEILVALPELMKKLNINNLSSIRGCAWN